LLSSWCEDGRLRLYVFAGYAHAATARQAI
jgi:hypothetical protein